MCWTYTFSSATEHLPPSFHKLDTKSLNQFQNHEKLPVCVALKDLLLHLSRSLTHWSLLDLSSLHFLFVSIIDLAGALVVLVVVVVVVVVEITSKHFEQASGLLVLYLVDLQTLQLSF